MMNWISSSRGFVLAAAFLVIGASQASATEEKPILKLGVVEDLGVDGNPDDVVFTVIGESGYEVPITRGEYKTELEYRLSLMPDPFVPSIMLEVIADIIKRASIMGYYEGELPSIKERLAPIQEALDDALGRFKEGDVVGRGRAFADVANAMSEDPRIKGSSRDGDVGYFPHGTMQYPFDRMAFTAEAGDMVGPFPTMFGYHFVYISRINRAPRRAQDSCSARHILVLWDRAEKKPFKRATEIVRSSRVRAEDPLFKELLPLGMQMGPGVILRRPADVFSSDKLEPGEAGPTVPPPVDENQKKTPPKKAGPSKGDKKG